MQDLNDKTTGSTLTAAEWNQIPSELQNVITDTGQTLSAGDLDQVGKGVAMYAGNGDFYTDGGAADAYTLTTIGSKQSSPAYVEGMRVRFVAANPGTGAAATVAVGSLGTKSIKLADGSNPAAGEIAGLVELIYDSSNDWFELSQAGQVKTQVFTSGATYNPPSRVRALKFTAVGGGGGGGGVDDGAAGTAAAAGGGGGGATAILTTTNIEASYTVTVGAAGSGGAAGNNSGAAGGNTTVVSSAISLTAGGGGGGAGQIADSLDAGTSGGSGGTASGGDVLLTGQTGGFGRTLVVAADITIAQFGQGGDSTHGHGTPTSTGNGTAGVGFGSGGSGAAVVGVATNFAGGDGTAGVVIVEEFY